MSSVSSSIALAVQGSTSNAKSGADGRMEEAAMRTVREQGAQHATDEKFQLTH
jgi:hypothetical protein